MPQKSTSPLQVIAEHSHNNNKNKILRDVRQLNNLLCSSRRPVGEGESLVICFVFFGAASPLRFVPARADYTILAERQRSFSAGGQHHAHFLPLCSTKQWGWFHVSVWQRRVCCPLEETRREVGELRVIVAERMRGGVAGLGFNRGGGGADRCLGHSWWDLI